MDENRCRCKIKILYECVNPFRPSKDPTNACKFFEPTPEDAIFCKFATPKRPCCCKEPILCQNPEAHKEAT